MTEPTDKQKKVSRKNTRGWWRKLIFPACVIMFYTLLCIWQPAQAVAALHASWIVLLQILPAMAVAFLVMIGLNLFIKPPQIKRFLGQGAGIRGVLLSSAAGILSMGPIYAWYPLLKEFREKGVSNFHLANFLGCRAVKIPLLPMMAAYFGWVFTGIVSVMMILNALVTGFIVAKTGKRA